MPAGWPGQYLFDDLAHPHVGALLEALDQTDHRNPRAQFPGQFDEYPAEPVRGNTHDDHVGAMGGLGEVVGGAQGFRQLDLLAEVGGVAVVGVDVLGGLRRTHPLHRGSAPGADGGDGGPPGSAAQHDDLGLATIRCHGVQGSAGGAHSPGFPQTASPNRANRQPPHPTSCLGTDTRPNTMSSSILSRKRKSIASARKSWRTTHGRLAPDLGSALRLRRT